jgi:hypothetical protein
MTRAQRNCRKKISYETVKDAGRAKAHFFLCNKTLLDIYECQICGKFHLTTKKPPTDLMKASQITDEQMARSMTI